MATIQWLASRPQTNTGLDKNIIQTMDPKSIAIGLAIALLCVLLQANTSIFTVLFPI
jgi:hypothetical protein